PNQSLADIYTNIDAARRYLTGLDIDAFKASEEKQQAVLHRLQSASEAATRLRNQWPERYDELVAAYPDVPWQRFRGLGDRYRHGYDLMDLDLVWSDLNGYLRDVQRAVSEELVLVNFTFEHDPHGNEPRPKL
ncbi:MAG: DUF86 domain-containing protein, partial [Candidatus Eremiobacteraeota bacterium]|nr:DUF86 domain-containing protein [Candidatus Eremiobacteraeota bacterium]